MNVDTLKILLVSLATILTQLWKMWTPESAATNGKYIATVLVVFGAFVNMVSLFAAPEIVVNNNWDLVLKITFALVEGALLGAASVGLYEFGNGVLGNVFLSTRQLLARKYGVVTETTIDTKTADATSLKAAGVEITSEQTVEDKGYETTTLTSKTPKKPKK